MSNNANKFLKKALGDDFLESLSKSELWKPGTKTVIDSEEIATALKIVPRTMMAILIRELAPMEIGQTKEISLPIPGASVIMNVTKHERDVYSGEIKDDNKMIVDFKYRSLPGLGLVIMSAFELYDVEELTKEPAPTDHSDIEHRVQKMIDERLQLHELVNKVVDRKLMQKEAVQHIVMAKLTEAMHEPEPTNSEIFKKEATLETKQKGSPLKGFLERKKKPNEFSIEMSKGESVNCPDCKKNIFDGRLFSGCICLGDDMEKKVFIKKTEDGIKVRFSRGWDSENIEMLLEVMRKKNGRG
jgi:hypothetical protein